MWSGAVRGPPLSRVERSLGWGGPWEEGGRMAQAAQAWGRSPRTWVCSAPPPPSKTEDFRFLLCGEGLASGPPLGGAEVDAPESHSLQFQTPEGPIKDPSRLFAFQEGRFEGGRVR